MSNTITLGILDDEMLLVRGLAQLLESDKDFSVIIKSSNGADFLEKLAQMPQLPDILLLDINMQPMNGLEVLEKLHELKMDIRVLVLSSLFNSSMYGYMIKYGISGFLPKYCEPEELFLAIRKIKTDKYYINDSNQQLLNEHLQNKKKIQDPWHMISLTDREKEILTLICQEYSTKEIADFLFVSVKTVESHRSKIMEKIGCKNLIGMVIYAIINGIYVLTNK